LAAKTIEWLRKREAAIALLTSGSHWRLIHASPDHDAFVEWEAPDWFDSGLPSPQFSALRQVLGIQAQRGGSPQADSPLMRALKASRTGRSELSQRMGE